MKRFQAIGFFFFFMASDSIGETSIRMPPTITKHPNKIVYFRGEGDAITLECQADGTPDITYKWEKNGADLNLNASNIKGSSNGTVKIEPSATSDEGSYQCFATNQYGTALSIVAYVHSAVLRLVSTTDVTNVTVKEGEPLHISFTTVTSFPKPTYGWEMAIGQSDKTPSLLHPSKRIQIADNGDLYFANVEAEDDLRGKLYKCTAYNPYLDVKSGGCYTRVIVTRVPGGAANTNPTLVTDFSSEPQVVGVVGGSVTLRCFFYGKPEPTISWSRPGSTLGLPRDRHNQNKDNTKLTIKITASDEGNYTCSAKNDAGEASHTIQLSIETEPSFKTTVDRPHNVNVSEGDTVTFHCRADAKPEADVVWLKNGKQFTAKDAPTRYVISPDKKSLTINQICLNCKDRDTDIVVIQCNASNRHGYAFASGYLNVFKKTRVEVEGERFVTVDIDNGTVEVELKCSVKYDPTTPVKWTWFKHQFYGNSNTSKDERVEEADKTIFVNGGSLKITIGVLNATEAKLRLLALLKAWRKYFGRYICVADNGISQSNGTIELQQFIPVTTPPAVTTEPPPPNCFFFDLPYAWLCYVVIAAVALLIVAFLVVCICCLCYHNRHRDEYDVDGKERWTGSNPEKELLANDFHESYRVETIDRTLKSSKASLSSATLMRIAEESSLNDYGGDDIGRFTEDGSFVGTYNSQNRGYM